MNATNLYVVIVVKNLKLNLDEKKHFCNICGNEFIKLSELTFHVDRVHCEPTPCPECGIKVKKLKLHMKTVHTPDELKKFQCKHCGKGFWLQNALITMKGENMESFLFL